MRAGGRYTDFGRTNPVGMTKNQVLLGVSYKF